MYAQVIRPDPDWRDARGAATAARGRARRASEANILKERKGWVGVGKWGRKVGGGGEEREKKLWWLVSEQEKRRARGFCAVRVNPRGVGLLGWSTSRGRDGNRKGPGPVGAAQADGGGRQKQNAGVRFWGVVRTSACDRTRPRSRSLSGPGRQTPRPNTELKRRTPLDSRQTRVLVGLAFSQSEHRVQALPFPPLASRASRTDRESAEDRGEKKSRSNAVAMTKACDRTGLRTGLSRLGCRVRAKARCVR